MTETGGVTGAFVNVCKGFGVGLASGEGVDEGGGIGWVWGLASGVWGGWRSDGAQAVVAGEMEGLFLMSASASRPAPPFTEMEAGGSDWRSDDGWSSRAAGAALCHGRDSRAPGTGG